MPLDPTFVTNININDHDLQRLDISKNLSDIDKWEKAFLLFETKEEEITKFISRYKKVGLFGKNKNLKIAELFCGKGNSLLALEKVGFKDIIGIDISQNLLNRYEGNVLEHIEKDEEELAWMYQNLQSGGHICIFVPALPWLYGSLDEKVDHFRRYTRKKLIAKTEQAGFEVSKAIYFDLPGVPLWWINFVLLRREMDPGAVHLYDKFVVPVLSKFEPSRFLPLGKNVLLVAKK
jgi:SAM-dependent methyltransferase